MDVIYAYTRAQAIDDGVLIDVSPMAREAGISYPTALTSAVWERYVRVPDGVSGQDENGRLWDVLWMFRVELLRSPKNRDSSQIFFELVVRNDECVSQVVTLKAMCGPGDSMEPVITMMLPEED